MILEFMDVPVQAGILYINVLKYNSNYTNVRASKEFPCLDRNVYVRL